MPSIMLNGPLATVDGVQVPVTTGSIKDVLAYLEKQSSKPAEPVKAPEAPKDAEVAKDAKAPAKAAAKPAEEVKE